MIEKGEGFSKGEALRRLSDENLAHNFRIIDQDTWVDETSRMRIRNEILDEMGRRIGDWEMWGIE